MANSSKIADAIVFGPRYWSRMWYSTKSLAFQMVRTMPGDPLADSLRKNFGIILTNQSPLKGFSDSDAASILDSLQRLNLQFKPGRELVIRNADDTTPQALSAALEVIAQQRAALEPEGLPSPVTVNRRHIISDSGVFLSIPTVETESEGVKEIKEKLGRSGYGLVHKLPDEAKRFIYPNIVEGYSPEVAAIDYKASDVAVYAEFDVYRKNKYSSAIEVVVNDVVGNGRKIEIHRGYGLEALRFLNLEGYVTYEVKIAGDNFYKLYLATRGTERKWAMCIADEGRIAHCQRMLKLSGVPGNAVSLVDHFRDPYEEFKKVMQTLIPVKPENVIIGNRGSFRRLQKRRKIAITRMRHVSDSVNALILRLGAQRSRPQLFKKLVGLTEKYPRLFNTNVAKDRLLKSEEAFVEYTQLERELEEIRKSHPEELKEIRTITSIFSDFKKLVDGLSRGSDAPTHKKIIGIFKDSAERYSGGDRDACLYIGRRMQELLEQEKKGIAEVLDMDPEGLFNDPKYFINLLRFDEVLASIHSEYPFSVELFGLKEALFENIKVGEKVITPYFRAQVLKSRDINGRDRVLLLVDVPYGDQARYLARYLDEIGVKNVLFSGICGGIAGVAVRDMLVPVYCAENGETLDGIRNRMLPVFSSGDSKRIKVGGHHIRVKTPFDETNEWLALQRKETMRIGEEGPRVGMKSVDVEVTAIAETLRDLKSSIDFGSILIVSDVFGGQTLEKTKEKDFVSEKETIMDRFNDFLGINYICETEEEKMITNQIKPNERGGLIENMAGTFNVKFDHFRKDKVLRLKRMAEAIARVESVDELNALIDDLRHWFSASIEIVKINTEKIESGKKFSGK
ncbi:MAG TPA: hypothetical protein VMD02_06745 [Candidatus Omnitrophota bacterium]|nr:hypothetical protein [Candidatus Omnitrophota bacterium]